MNGWRTMIVVGGAVLIAASLPAMAQLGVASGVASSLADRGVVTGTQASGLAVHFRGNATVPGFRRQPRSHNLHLRFGHRLHGHHFHRARGRRGSGFRPGLGRKHFLRLPFSRPLLFPVVNSLVVADIEPSLRGQQFPMPEITLLALKDGTVYTATEYWLEGDQVFYVTGAGREDSFPIEELDWDVSANLNAERGVDLVLRPATRLHAPEMPKARQGSRHIRVPVTIAQDRAGGGAGKE